MSVILPRAIQELRGHTGLSPSTTAPTTDHDGAFPRLPFGIDAIDGLLGGGLRRNAFHEVRCEHARALGGATGLLLGLLARLRDASERRILWVLDPAVSLDGGQLFPQGVSQFGLDPACLTFVTPCDLQNALWTTDEAVKCTELAAVVFQTKGNPARFDITATRRLMLRARASGVFACALRQSADNEASAAETRWRVEVQPSLPEKGVAGPEEGVTGMTAPRWRLTLEKNRKGQTGQWPLAWNSQRKAFEHAAETCPSENSGHRLHPSTERQRSTAQMGQVMAFERAS